MSCNGIGILKRKLDISSLSRFQSIINQIPCRKGNIWTREIHRELHLWNWLFLHPFLAVCTAQCTQPPFFSCLVLQFFKDLPVWDGLSLNSRHRINKAVPLFLCKKPSKILLSMWFILDVNIVGFSVSFSSLAIQGRGDSATCCYVTLVGHNSFNQENDPFDDKSRLLDPRARQCCYA